MGMVMLLTGVTSAGPPSAATDGKPLRRGAGSGTDIQVGFDTPIEDAVCELWSTAGSGAMTAAVRLWGFSAEAATWFPIGITPAAGTDTNRGLLNNGVTIGEMTTVADKLAFAQVIGGLRVFTRVAAEIVGALGGVSTAISVGIRNL